MILLFIFLQLAINAQTTKEYTWSVSSTAASTTTKTLTMPPTTSLQTALKGPAVVDVSIEVPFKRVIDIYNEKATIEAALDPWIKKKGHLKCQIPTKKGRFNGTSADFEYLHSLNPIGDRVPYYDFRFAMLPRGHGDETISVALLKWYYWGYIGPVDRHFDEPIKQYVMQKFYYALHTPEEQRPPLHVGIDEWWDWSLINNDTVYSSTVLTGAYFDDVGDRIAELASLESFEPEIDTEDYHASAITLLAGALLVLFI